TTTGSALFSQQFALAPEQFRPDTMRYGHVPFRIAARRGSRTDQYRQDPLRDRADARSSKRHDRLSAAALGAGELRPARQVARRTRGCADYRGGEDPAPEPVLFRLHG